MAAECYELAIETKRAVQREGLRHGELLAGNKRDVLSGGRSKWFDDQQRLDTQHALCLALSGDFSKAFRRLNNSNLVLEALQLHSREESMLKWLANENVESGRYTKVLGATHVLEKLMLARRALDAEEKKTVLNEDVSTFVSNVIGFSKRVARFTTKNLERTKSVSIVPPKF